MLDIRFGGWLVAIPVLVAFAGTVGAADRVVVPRKTPVLIELLENLDSKRSRPGDEVRFRVDEDVTVEGRAVFRAGDPVAGRVKFVERSRSNGRPGTVQVVVPTIRTAGANHEVAMFGELTASGRSRSGTAAGTMIAVGVAGFGVHGRQAFHLKGEIFEVLTREEEQLELTRHPAPRQPGPVAAVEPARRGETVEVTYKPRKSNLPQWIDLSIPSGEAPPSLRPVRAEIVAVGTDALAPPIPSERLTVDATAWRCRFEGWSLVRHLAGGPEGTANDVDLILHFPDGTTVRARTEVVLRLL